MIVNVEVLSEVYSVLPPKQALYHATTRIFLISTCYDKSSLEKGHPGKYRHHSVSALVKLLWVTGVERVPVDFCDLKLSGNATLTHNEQACR